MRINDKTIYELINDEWTKVYNESHEHDPKIDGPIDLYGVTLPWYAWLIIQIILSYVTYQMVSSMGDSGVDQEEVGLEVNTRSTKEPLQILYGMRSIAGNDVYMTTGDEHNKKLFITTTLSEGTCSGIYQKEGVGQVFIDDKIYTEYGDNVSYTFYTGASGQSYDSALNTFNNEWTDNMRNVSYIIYEFWWDLDLFRGIPKRKLTMKGKLVKNLLNNDIVEYSNNVVNCLYDFITNTRYGLSIPESIIDKASFVETAQYVADKGWELNLAVRPNINSGAWSIVQDMLKHFRGTLNWWDGKYYLRYADLYEESSVFTIEDKHIQQSGDGKAEITLTQPSRFNKANGVRITFYDETKDYIEDYITIGEETGVIEDIVFNGITNKKYAADIGTYYLERMNLDRVLSGTFRSDCVQLEPHDIITFNSTAMAIEDQLMRVASSNVNADGSVNLDLMYESYDLYDDDFDDTIEDVYQISLPDPSTASLISNPGIAEEIYYYRLVSYSRLNITFRVPADEVWFKHCEVWVSVNGDVDANYTHQFNSVSNFDIDPAEEGQVYWIKLRVVNIWGVKQDLDQATKLSKLIVGKSLTKPPSPNPLNIGPGTNALNLYSQKIYDPDIEHYEFRLGTWSGGTFLSSVRSPNYSIQNIKPSEGTPFIFSLDTRGSNDLYGETPVTASANIDYPTGFSSYDVFNGTYTVGSGTHDGTEEISAGEYAGYLTTQSGTVSGTFTSNTIDIGVLDTYYIWWSADIVTLGAGTTWDDQFPAPNLWSQGGVNQQWYKIFELDEAPSLNVRLGYKATGGADWQYISHAELIAGVIYARYFNVEITINDPSEVVYAVIEPYALNFYSRD